MGYGKVGVSKDEMLSYKQKHNSAVHTAFTHQFTASTTGIYLVKVYRTGNQASGSFFIDDALITHEEEVTQTVCMDIGDYKWSFQNQLKDNEVSGIGNHIVFKYRGQDVRLGRLNWSVDRLFKKYPWNSPYAFSENRLIDSRELEGLERFSVHFGTRKIVQGQTVVEVREVALIVLEETDVPLEVNFFDENSKPIPELTGLDNFKFKELIELSELFKFEKNENTGLVNKVTFPDGREFEGKGEPGEPQLVGQGRGASIITDRPNQKVVGGIIVAGVNTNDDGTTTPVNFSNIITQALESTALEPFDIINVTLPNNQQNDFQQAFNSLGINATLNFINTNEVGKVGIEFIQTDNTIGDVDD